MQAHGNACKNFNAGLTHTETQTFVRAAFAAKKEKKKVLIGQVGLGEYTQNGNVYPNPHDFSIYTDYLKSLYTVVPKEEFQE